jgi:hypothetical protein
VYPRHQQGPQRVGVTAAAGETTGPCRKHLDERSEHNHDEEAKDVHADPITVIPWPVGEEHLHPVPPEEGHVHRGHVGGHVHVLVCRRHRPHRWRWHAGGGRRPHLHRRHRHRAFLEIAVVGSRVAVYLLATSTW